jgi:hypothetical protein
MSDDGKYSPFHLFSRSAQAFRQHMLTPFLALQIKYVRVADQILDKVQEDQHRIREQNRQSGGGGRGGGRGGMGNARGGAGGGSNRGKCSISEIEESADWIGVRVVGGPNRGGGAGRGGARGAPGGQRGGRGGFNGP